MRISVRSVVVARIESASGLQARLPSEPRAMHGQQLHQIGNTQHDRVDTAAGTKRGFTVIDPVYDLGRLVHLKAMKAAAPHGSSFGNERLYRKPVRFGMALQIRETGGRATAAYPLDFRHSRTAPRLRLGDRTGR